MPLLSKEEVKSNRGLRMNRRYPPNWSVCFPWIQDKSSEKIMRWALVISGPSNARRRDEIKVDHRLVRVAKCSKTFTKKPVVETAEQIWADDRRASDDEPFVVIYSLSLRKCKSW